MGKIGRRLEKAQEILEEADGIAKDYEEGGIKQVLDSKAEDLIGETATKIAGKTFGASNPALWFLPEFIKAQRGFGVVRRDDMEQQRKDYLDALGLNDYPTLEEVEELFKNEESEILKDITDEYLKEVGDIIDNLKDSDQIAENEEEEIPKPEEKETDEYDESPSKKCRSVTTVIGNKKISFNTCDQTDYAGNEPDAPQPPRAGKTACPIIKQIVTRLDDFAGDIHEVNFESTIVAYWSPRNLTTRIWLDEQIKNKTITWMSGYSAYVAIPIKYEYRIHIIKVLDEEMSFTDISYGEVTKNLNKRGIWGWERVYSLVVSREYHYCVPNLSFSYHGDKGRCLSNYQGGNQIEQPRKFDAETIEENNVDNDCCLATLALTRKIALNIGAIPDTKEQYPSNIKPQQTEEDYGFPFKIPKSWLEPDTKGEIVVYNSKQLLLILGRLLAENYQALRPNEILDKGVEYPNRWIAPRGKGKSKAKNYLELFEVLGKMLDHLGIHPTEATLADLDPANPGKQPWGVKTHNATHAIKLLLEYVKETDGDQAAALNLNLRESVLLGQMFIMISAMAESQLSLFQALGFEVEEEVDYIEGFPFDFTLGAEATTTSGRGFSSEAQAAAAEKMQKQYEKILKELASNDEKGAEAVLEKFLQTRKQPFIYNRLKATKSLLEMLNNVGSK